MEIGHQRLRLHFVDSVHKQFAFLGEYGFTETESLPTLVRYRKGDLEIDIYHGRQSFEVGFGITYQGTRYSLSEFIRVADPAAAEQYRNEAARTSDGIAEILTHLQKTVQRYSLRALQGDAEYFSMLKTQREVWAEEYALDVLARQVRQGVVRVSNCLENQAG